MWYHRLWHRPSAAKRKDYGTTVPSTRIVRSQERILKCALCVFACVGVRISGSLSLLLLPLLLLRLKNAPGQVPLVIRVHSFGSVALVRTEYARGCRCRRPRPPAFKK